MSYVCIVITLKDYSDPLVKYAISLNSENLHFLRASTPADLESQLNSANSVISPIEMAISLSHKRARDLGISLDSDWVLIFEEDAIQLAQEHEVYSFLKNLDEFLGHETPKAVHFAPEQFGVMCLHKSQEFYSTLILADCAVAYALNRSALRVISSVDFSLSEVADWPKTLRKLNWYSPKSAFYKHPDLHGTGTSSTSEDREARNIRQRNRVFIFSARNYKTILFLVLAKFGKNYGSGYVVKERFRSKVLLFYSK